MKKFLFLLAALFALAANEASANECLYTRFFGGVNWLSVSHKDAKVNFKTGYLVGGSLGYKWCNSLRTEAEITYRRNDLKNGHWRNQSFEDNGSFKQKLHGHHRSIAYMANLLYDIPIDCNCWSIYVGGGIGYADQRLVFKHDGSSGDDCGCSEFSNSGRRNHNKKNGFAAQGIVGFAYNFCENIDFEIEYRYFYVCNNLKASNNDLVFGIRAGF